MNNKDLEHKETAYASGSGGYNTTKGTMPINKQEELSKEVEKFRERYEDFIGIKKGEHIFKIHSDYFDSIAPFWLEELSKSILEAKQEARKAILEEVRSIVGDDEEENECIKNGHQVINSELGGKWCNDCWLSEDSTKDEEAVGRNKLRAEQRQKLSLLEGAK